MEVTNDKPPNPSSVSGDGAQGGAIADALDLLHDASAHSSGAVHSVDLNLNDGMDDDLGISIGGFAIDSDDEDLDDEDLQVEEENGITNVDPLNAAVAAAVDGLTEPKSARPQVERKPSRLQGLMKNLKEEESPVSVKSNSPSSDAASNGASGGGGGLGSMAESFIHPLQDFARSMPTAVTSLTQQSNPSTGTSTPVEVPPASQSEQQPPAASVSAKPSTSKASHFTSALAGFASQAASRIQSQAGTAWTAASSHAPAATQIPPVDKSLSNVSAVPSETSSVHPAPISTAAQPQPQSEPSTTGGPTTSSGAVPKGSEMDNSQKSLLIQSALGPLLPGERVIMFLSHLVSVSSSSSTNDGIGIVNGRALYDYVAGSQKQADDDVVWCVAMTFYRVVLFSYRESDFSDSLLNFPPAVASKEESEKRLKSLVGSASVSPQFLYHATSSRLGNNSRRHDVLQMPLASIERVEKSSEFVPSSASGAGGNFYSGALSAAAGGISAAAGAAVASSGAGGGVGGTGLGLVIHGKDNGRQIRFTTPSYGDTIRAHEALNTYAFPGRRNLGYLFAFESRRAEVMSSIQRPPPGESGASNAGGGGKITAKATRRRFEAMKEYGRQGILQPRHPRSSSNNETIPPPWVPLVTANAQYSLCNSYPSVLIVPSKIDESTPDGMRLLRKTAGFRSEHRIPSLTWGSKHHGGSIWRSSQPKVGLQGNRCTDDELFLRFIAESSTNANRAAGKWERPSVEFLRMLTGNHNDFDLIIDNSGGGPGGTAGGGRGGGPSGGCGLKIFDLRPKSSAIANRTGGYGYENTSNYPQATISFLNIGNIHAVRDSYMKLSTLCLNPTISDVQWTQLVEDTKWLFHVRLILSASWQTAFHVRYNRLPVLVHCSHGWDRTSQVCALAQILLDSHYRTCEGFATLVEKDFLSFGHPLHTRCGHGEGKGDRGAAGSGGASQGGSGGGGDEGQIAPIFIQFLDCVYQIVRQYPEHFEFNDRYLLSLSEHVYSCRFGTLLCDTEREREIVAGIRQRTHCLWDFLDSDPRLINPFYNRVNEGGDSPLMMPLPTLLRNVTLWADRHCRCGPKATMRTLPEGLMDDDVWRTCVGGEAGKVQEATEPGRGDGMPLHSALDCNTAALQKAVQEAEHWRRIAEEREKELDALRSKEESNGSANPGIDAWNDLIDTASGGPAQELSHEDDALANCDRGAVALVAHDA